MFKYTEFQYTKIKNRYFSENKKNLNISLCYEHVDYAEKSI